MPTFSSLVAPEVVEMATFGVSGNQTTHGFHSISVVQTWFDRMYLWGYYKYTLTKIIMELPVPKKLFCN